MKIPGRSSRTCVLVVACVLVVSLAGAAPTNLVLDWVERLPVGASLTAGMAGLVVDADGVSYITGISGASSNTDVTTAAYGPDGSLLWSRVYNGPANGSDQARGLAVAGGVLYVTGNTPGPNSFAQVLLLAYDAGTGNLQNAVQYSSGPSTSEHGASVAVAASGRVFVAGGTVGDGGDALVLAFDPAGQLLWKRTWDGPASAPFSQDTALEVLVDQSGDPVVLIHGVMASLHPDYVVVKYSGATGAPLWQANWGVSGEDSPSDLELDAQGDVYVTGTGLNLRNEYSTIKLRGSDGALVWQAYDAGGLRDSAAALTLDGKGGVFVTGRVDPDGNQGNFNDNMYTVKRDAANGTFRWSHVYGANCVGCFDPGRDVSVDPEGNVFVTGPTSSAPYSSDAIVIVLDSGSGLETDRGIVAGGPNESVDSRSSGWIPRPTSCGEVASTASIRARSRWAWPGSSRWAAAAVAASRAATRRSSSSAARTRAAERSCRSGW